MWQAIVKWYASHTITTKSLTAAAIMLTTLYASVPAFKTLVDTMYASTGPKFHLIAGAALGITGYLLLANKTPTPPPTPPTVA